MHDIPFTINQIKYNYLFDLYCSVKLSNKTKTTPGTKNWLNYLLPSASKLCTCVLNVASKYPWVE